MEHRLSSLHVCLPGVVQSYDATKQTASVQPAIKNVIVTGAGEQEIAFPVIPDVPVAHPRAGKWFVHLPLSPGDSVLLVFGERSIDTWRQLGGTQNPLDLRKHDLSDAIAIPGNLYPDANPLVGMSADHLSLGASPGSSIHVNADGSIAVGSAVPIDSVATATKVGIDAALIAAFFTAVGAIPAVTDLVTAIAALNVLVTAAKVPGIAGYPHDVASSKVKVDP